MRLKRISFLIIVLFIFTLLSVACQQEVVVAEPQPTASNTDVPQVADPATDVPTEVPTETPTELPTETAMPTMTPTPLDVGPNEFPDFINPLTGLTVTNVSLLERNPVMVKVSNFPRGLRPHTGLTWADLVFEYYIGAGATRYSAIYYGQNAPEVGPVRSARLIDAQLGNLYQSILAFASADSRVYFRVNQALGDRAVTEGPGTCPAMCRSGSGDVNSVRVIPALMTDYVNDTRGLTPVRPVLDGTSFTSIAPEGGNAGELLTVRYSLSTISEWRYDASSNLYLRYIEEVNAEGEVSVVPLIDALTDTQLTASNVIVMFVETIELSPTLHDFNLANNFYGQRALLFRDGQVYELLWKSQGTNLPIQFFGQVNGELMPLKPGNSWFHVVGIYSSQEETSPGAWEIYNYLP